MGVVHINAQFKVLTGTVETTLGAIPKKGAIVFHIGLNALFYGDGFNWNPLGAGQEPIDSLATKLATPLTIPLVALTPTPVTWFDTIVYNTGTAYTPDLLLQQLLINTTGNFQVNSGYQVATDVNNLIITTYTTVNGVRRAGESTTLGQKNTPYNLYASDGVSFTAGDIVTVEFEVNKSCNLTYGNLNIGIQSIV